MRLCRCATTLAVVAILMGCGSTPYSDDYTPYINNMHAGTIGDATIAFQFVDHESIDLRGKYSHDDEVGASHVLYPGGPGGAGIAALLVQIGTHSAMVNSQRQQRLKAQQEAANAGVAELIGNSDSIELTTLLNAQTAHWFEANNNVSDTVTVKPIFFSNQEMNQLSMNMIVWINDPASKRGQAFLYRNMIQVHGSWLNSEESAAIKQQPEALSIELSKILNTGLIIANSDLNGSYAENASKTKTYYIGGEDQRQIVRGVHVDSMCQFDIIKNLHNWYVAYKNETPKAELALGQEC